MGDSVLSGSLLLSDHVKRYTGPSPDTVDSYVQKIRQAFTKDSEVTSLGESFLNDFASKMAEVYREIKTENAKLRAEVKQAKEKLAELEGRTTDAPLNDTMESLLGQYGPLLGNVERINLNSLVKKPEVFNGLTPHPSEWLRDYRDAITDNQWNEATAVYYFKHFLRGDAEAWFTLQVKPKINSEFSVNQLFELFEANYLGRAERDRLRAELASVRMVEADRVANFIYRVIRYLTLLDPKMSEYEQVQRVAEKLRPEFAMTIVDRDPQTIEELRDLCRKVEAARDLRKLSQQDSRNADKRDTSKQNDSKGRGNRPPFRRGNGGNSSKDGSSEGRQDRTRGVCYRCGRNNHLRRDCVAKTKLDGTKIEDKKSKEDQKVNLVAQEQMRELNEVIQRNRLAFSLQGEIGCANEHEHKIELLENAKPVVEPARRRPQAHVIEANKQVKQMLEDKIIEPSSSPWSSAYVVVKKKTGDFRICIDFRKLNEVTKKDAYPLPNIETCLEAIAGKSFYSSFDLAAGYWQVKMEDRSKEYTAFRTEEGHFQFVRMPFGLCNAPASFQRLMNVQFANLKGMALQIYLDDVCIASSSWSEHLIMLEQFLKTLIESNLKLKASKCTLASGSIKFLGHEISSEGISQDRDKVKAIEQMPRPTNLSELRRVIGLLSYYRKFVPQFAQLADPLTSLTKKGAMFVWQKEQEQAFVSLVERLKQNAVLVTFNCSDPVALKTDASRTGIGGILMQQQNGIWKIVCCYSRRLSDCEKNYGVTDLEGLAVVEAMRKFRPYLLGRKFDLIVDHCSLCILQKRLSNSPRIRRWSLLLQEYDFNVVYKKGSLHVDVDCLSRAPLDDDNDYLLDTKICTLYVPVDLDEWSSSYTDEESKELLALAAEEKEGFKIVNDIIYLRSKIFVPSSKRLDILKAAHSSPRGGHRGIHVTAAKLKDCWWPTFAMDVTDYVRSCHECQERKVERAKPKGAMESFHAVQPFDLVCVDTCGPIPESLNGFCYIIVAIDVFTRFVEARAIKETKAEECASFLLDYFSRYGPPKAVRSDNGPQFLNDLVKETSTSFGVKMSWSTADHSQGNSPVERSIQTIQEALALSCRSQLELDNWDSILPITIMALNTSLCASTGYTPYELLFGREMSVLDNHLSRSAKPQDIHTQLIKLKLDQAYARAIEQQEASRASNTRSFNSRHRFQEYKVGDLVMMRCPNRRKGKLDKRFTGPYRVTSKNNAVYEVEELDGNRNPTGKLLQRHLESLKIYRDARRGNLQEMDDEENEPRVATVSKRCSTPILASLLMGLLAIVGVVDTHLWQEEPSIMWTWTDKTVFGKMVVYDILMVNINPCDSLSTEGLKYQGTKLEANYSTGTNSAAHNMHEAMVERCNQVYEVIWEKAVTDALVMCNGRLDKPPTYNKRGVIGDAFIAATVGGTFFGPGGAALGFSGAVVSDLVGAIWDHYNPFSNNNQISNIAAKVQELIMARHEDLNAFKNVTAHSVRVLNSTLRVVQQSRNELNQLMSDLPEYIFAANAIMDYINHGARLLRSITNLCRRNVDTVALSELVQRPELAEISPQDTQWITITAPQVRSLHFVFRVVEPSADTHLVRISAFDYWDVSRRPAKLLHYDGPEHILYNRTSRCAKQIQVPQTHVVFDRCAVENFRSAQLSKWTVLRNSTNVLKETQVTTVKDGGSTVWVYCFPGNITVNGKLTKCPHSVISLPPDVRFITSDFAYDSPKIEENKTRAMDIRLGAHFAHSAINEQHELFEELESYREVDEKYEPKPLDELTSHGQWILLSTLLPLIVLLIGLVAYLNWRHYKSMQESNVQATELTVRKRKQSKKDNLVAVDNSSQSS